MFSSQERGGLSLKLRLAALDTVAAGKRLKAYFARHINRTLDGRTDWRATLYNLAGFAVDLLRQGTIESAGLHHTNVKGAFHGELVPHGIRFAPSNAGVRRVSHYRHPEPVLLSDCTVSARFGHIRSRNGLLIREAFQSEAHQRFLRTKRLLKPQPNRQITGTLIPLESEPSNYYHIHVDYLPRLCFIASARGMRSPVRIPLRLTIWERYKDLLTALLPQDVEILWMSGEGPAFDFAPENILLLPYVTGHQWGYIPRPILDRFEERGIISAKTFGSQRIFISRRDANVRRLSNEDEIYGRLRSEGFKRYCLSELSPSEQRCLFSDAEFIVAPHGAGLTNLLFAPPSCRVCEIKPIRNLYHYEGLALSKGQQYASLVENARHKDDDFSANADEVLRIVRYLSSVGSAK